MRRLVLPFCFVLASCTPYVERTPYAGEPAVRVALLEDVDSVAVSSTEDLVVALGGGQSAYPAGTAARIVLTADSLAILIGDSLSVAAPILPARFSSSAGTLLVNGRPFRGIVEVRRPARLLVVNLLPMEQYLLGVVPCEIGARDPVVLEAVKAQAIAARSYALRRSARARSPDFDLYASVSDQVYRGRSVETDVGTRAVNETRGLVACYQDEIIDAKYHSTCGGLTADANAVWSGAPVPYLRRAWDRAGHCLGRPPLCAGTPHFQWQQRIAVADLARAVGSYLAGAYRLGDVPAVGEFRNRHMRPRPSLFCAVTDRGDYDVPGTVMRRLFNLPSDYFRVSRSGGDYVLRGFGWGHGVGMCQWGAMAMARRGAPCGKILRQYYAGVRVKRAYE